MGNRESILSNKNALEKAIDQSSSQKEVLIHLGLSPVGGGNHKALKEAAQRFDLELPRFDRSKQLEGIRSTRLDDEVFCTNSDYNNRAHLKKRLYQSGVKEECAICGLGPEWNNGPLTLQLDHINGIWNDNRKENLRILCPNCHSQTDTFAGRGERTLKRKYFCECGVEILKTSSHCQKCSASKRYDVKYPPYEELKKLVKQIGYSAAGRRLGCTDNAIRAHLRKLEREMSV